MTVCLCNNQVIVIFPFDGTPPIKQGFASGDVIIAIDGKSTENMGTTDVADSVEGSKRDDGAHQHFALKAVAAKAMAIHPGAR